MPTALIVSYALDDEKLAEKLEAAARVTLLHRGFHFMVEIQRPTETIVCTGEVGKRAFAVLSRASKSGLLYVQDWPDTLSDRPTKIDIAIFAGSKPLKPADLSKWNDARNELLKAGRGKRASQQVNKEVMRDALHLCMYPGCGERLDQVGASSRIGNVGQLAHIVGADPLGPRGRSDSHALAGKASNLMLLCYKHHRLIDEIDPEAFSIATLEKMRIEHVRKVDSLVAKMKWPVVRPLIIRGGIAGQAPAITRREIDESLEALEVTATADIQEYLSSATAERPTENYGALMLGQLKPSIANLITTLQGRDLGPASDDGLAVYALHDTPVLILAGRLIGEARHVHVMQRNRDTQSWKWQDAAAATPSIKVDLAQRARAQSKGMQAVLTIALSDQFQESWLSPSMLSEIGAGRHGWMSIDTASPAHNVIKSPADLAQVMTNVRSALRTLQGDMNASEIHLIVVAPVSVALSIGRALQAGNHPPIIVYHRPNGTVPFQPAFRITGERVENADPPIAGQVSVALQ